MKNVYNFLIIMFLSSVSGFAQQVINSKILDSISTKPIPFATVSTSKNSGVISNSSGSFTLNLSKKHAKNDSLFVRCLGYETKRFLLKSFTDSIIRLSPKSIELDEVLVSNKDYSAEEIIDRILGKHKKIFHPRI